MLEALPRILDPGLQVIFTPHQLSHAPRVPPMDEVSRLLEAQSSAPQSLHALRTFETMPSELTRAIRELVYQLLVDRGIGPILRQSSQPINSGSCRGDTTGWVRLDRHSLGSGYDPMAKVRNVSAKTPLLHHRFVGPYFMPEEVLVQPEHVVSAAPFFSACTPCTNSRESLKTLLEPVFLGAHALHTELGLVHRDLKWSNVFCVNGKAYIGDFEAIRPVESPLFRTLFTPLYDDLSYFPASRKQEMPAQDVFSVGIMSLIAACGGGQQVRTEIEHGDGTEQYSAQGVLPKTISWLGKKHNLSEPLLKLILDMTDPQPDKRPSMINAYERLKALSF